MSGKPQRETRTKDIPEYITWCQMKGRCYNKNDPRYHKYGGRGITVCDRWRHSFDNFYTDMGQRPFKNAQIDRIDNDGNYCPTNCEWVTLKHNCRHRTTSKLSIEQAEEIRLIYSTEKISQTELGARYGISHTQVSYIVNNKQWS